MKSSVIRILFTFSLILACGLAIFADTIRLKDGSIIKGKIVGFRDGQFTVQIGDGSRSRQMTFFADEVEAVEFDGSSEFVKTNQSSNSSVLPRPSSTPKTVPVPTPTPNNSQSNSSVQPEQTTNSAPTQSNSSSTSQPNTIKAKPIQLNIKVLADNTANGWTNSGWVVKKGQKIRITGNGRISLGGGNYSTPAGLASLADKDKLMQNQATGGLIAVIGDDNNDFIFVGNGKEFTATRDGALFLGINEGMLDDNSGSYDVVIEVDAGF